MYLKVVPVIVFRPLRFSDFTVVGLYIGMQLAEAGEIGVFHQNFTCGVHLLNIQIGVIIVTERPVKQRFCFPYLVDILSVGCRKPGMHRGIHPGDRVDGDVVGQVPVELEDQIGLLTGIIMQAAIFMLTEIVMLTGIVMVIGTVMLINIAMLTGLQVNRDLPAHCRNVPRNRRRVRRYQFCRNRLVKHLPSAG